MTVNLNASLSQGFGISSDTSGVVTFQTNGTETVRINTSGNMGIGTTSPTQKLDVSGNVNSTGTVIMSSPYTMRNKIINGAMMIDQRYSGASTTASNYILDRWVANYSSGTMTSQRSTTAPVGFYNSFSETVTSAGTRNAADQFIIYQNIEGFNIADLDLGLSTAVTTTLSFWVRSSVAGTYSGVIGSGDNNRSYAFTYTINSANTWEFETITIPGDTSGGRTAYPIDNTTGLRIKFDLGSGSNYQITAGSWQAAVNKTGVAGTVSWAQTAGATFFISGVQLERGTVATPFEYRNYQQELAMCQRYFEMSYDIGTVPGTAVNANNIISSQNGTATTGYIGCQVFHKVQKRTTPTITIYDLAGASGKCTRTTAGSGADNGQTVASDNVGTYGFQIVSSSGTNRQYIQAQFTSAAEL